MNNASINLSTVCCLLDLATSWRIVSVSDVDWNIAPSLTRESLKIDAFVKFPLCAHAKPPEAISDSSLSEDEISNNQTGLIMGSGGPSTKSLLRAFDITREKGPKKIGPTSVPKVMCSTNSATLSTYFKIKGVNYSISSACSTSAHCIGNAYELIQLGKQDRIFAGGGEELDF